MIVTPATNPETQPAADPAEPVLDTSPPTVPVNVQATAVTTNRIDISWNSATDNLGVTAYNIYKNGSNSLFTSTPDLSFSDSGLNADQDYSYRVSAIDEAGNESEKSTVLRVRTHPAPDTTAPTTPTGLRSTSVTSERITLGWNAANDNLGVTEYRLYKNNSASHFATTSSLSFTDTGLIPDQTYSYRLSAVDAAGNESTRSGSLVVNTLPAPDTTPPSIPTGLRPTNISSDTITLAWTASSDNQVVTGYRLYRDGSTTPLATAALLSYTDTGLFEGQSYQYRISAIDEAGNESSMSGVVTVATVITSDPRPINLTWQTPTQYTDDSCLSEINGYRLSYGNISGSYSVTEELTPDTASVTCVQTGYNATCDLPVMTCSYSTQALKPGTWHFVIQAYDTERVLSDYSNEVEKIIN